MKKNWKWFLVSLIVLIFSTLAIIGLPLGWWYKEPNQPFVVIIIFWAVEIAAAITFGFNIKSFQKKPNYNFTEIKEENFFKIISIAPNFDGLHLDYMHVDLNGFGETLILFPLNKNHWYDGYPKPGQTWIRRRNFFVLVPES